jgi:hypothetical protein
VTRSPVRVADFGPAGDPRIALWVPSIDDSSSVVSPHEAVRYWRRSEGEDTRDRRFVSGARRLSMRPDRTAFEGMVCRPERNDRVSSGLGTETVSNSAAVRSGRRREFDPKRAPVARWNRTVGPGNGRSKERPRPPSRNGTVPATNRSVGPPHSFYNMISRTESRREAGGRGPPPRLQRDFQVERPAGHSSRHRSHGLRTRFGPSKRTPGG